MTEQFCPQPENPKQNSPEAGAGPIGLPPPDPERQPLPSIWDVLERKVRLRAPDVENRPRGQEYYCELREVNQLLDELDEKGTNRDRLTEELYNTITIQPRDSLPVPFEAINLSLEEFQQLRSRVEPLSDEELREEVRQTRAERQRKWDEIHTRNSDLPPRLPSLGRP